VRRSRLVVLVLAGWSFAIQPLPAEESTAVRAAGRDVEAKPLEFTRVHVPAGRLTDIPLGTSRYVPMSAREFEEGIARLTAGRPAAARDGLQPALVTLADAARYDIALTEDGSLAGTVSFDIGASAEAAGGKARPPVGFGRELSLGSLDVRAAAMRTDAGLGEAVVFGRRDGTLAVSIPEAGTYSCDFRCEHAAGSLAAPRFSLTLVPSLSSTIALRLPRGLRPVVGGGLEARKLPEPRPDPSTEPVIRPTASAGDWQIDTGPRALVDLTLVGADQPPPMISLWTEVAIRGRQSTLGSLVRPADPWVSGRLRLEKDVGLIVTDIAVAAGDPVDARDRASWTVVDEGRAILIDLPRWCLGTVEPLLVRAVAPISGPAAPLPLLRPTAETWAGGGIAIRVVPELSLAAVEFERCLIVPPEVATRWPLPVGGGTDAPDAVVRSDDPANDAAGQDEAVAAAGPARLFVEEQGPGASVTLSLAPRAAELDVARVTTVDLSPGLVVARAACNVRVHRGESFDLTARITPGWFIDSVEAITLGAPAELAASPVRRDVDESAAGQSWAGLDWKVIRDARGDVLRIGLTVAATPARDLGLRITGHRAGIPLGEGFSTAAVDMVRLDGESERSALVDLRTNPETIVEFDTPVATAAERSAPANAGQADGEVGLDGRLAALVEDGAARARIRAGFRAFSRTARLVRRRPPLDVRSDVRLTVRDDRLTESFTFACEPSGADLDSIVVQFSTPVDDRLEWSLVPPAVGTVSARRLDSADRRGGTGGVGAVGAERWLVELNPPSRAAVTIKAARTIPFSRAMPVPLAWVDGATSKLGHCMVRSAGRSRPRLINRRLTEVPPESAVVEPGSVTLAEFAFDPTVAGDTADDAAAELLPGGDDARAWAWRETVVSWCHASGATEHETLFEIDNQGRTSLALAIPRGHRVQGILLDGLRLPLGDRAPVGGVVPIELPAGRARVNVLVQTVAGGRVDGIPGGGWSLAWRVDPAGVTLDIPVLERQWRLLMPPELEVALVGGSARLVGGAAENGDWARRLWAIRGTITPPEPRVGGGGQGVRDFVLVPGGDVADVLVVRARVLSAATIIVALIAGCGTLVVARANMRAAVLVSLVAGVAALWLVAPFDAIARAAWWASLAAVAWAALAWWRSWHALRKGTTRAAQALLVFGLCLAVEPARAADAEPATAAPGRPLQVFITPIAAGHEGERRGESTVLVPEELFRAIIRGEAGRGGAGVRVLEVRVTARVPEGDDAWPAWRLAIDVDADTGGILPLDQTGGGGRHLADTLEIDGVAAAARLDADGGLLRVVMPAAGRHTVTLGVDPASERRGDVETATIAVPFAPGASLECVAERAGAGGPGGVICERASSPGAFVAAPRLPAGAGGVVFDVARSVEVRLTRPVKTGRELALLPPNAVSRNDIFWNLDECRLTGVYEIEAHDAILRSCVVTADRGLEWIPPPPRQEDTRIDDASLESGVSIRPLGGRRYLVERRRPEPGRFRFEIPFRMPVADPVGVFDVPEAWLEDVLVDSRTVRFVASPSLSVRIDLPPGAMHMAVPEGEASFETRFWQGQVSRSFAFDARAGSVALQVPRAAAFVPSPRARLTSERRRQDLRGSQRETITFAGDQVLIRLDARLDASSSALVSIPLEVPERCVVDRIELVEDEVLHPETAERGSIDVRWSRSSETGVDVIVQRPRAGRFRLEVDARIPGRPPARGRMPCLRVGLADGSRTLIAWRAEDGLRATLDRGAGQRAATGEMPVDSAPFELVTGDAPPSYLLEPIPTEPAPSTAAPDEPGAMPVEGGAAGNGRVELADIRLVADERGRMWGLACFELVPSDRVVRIRLPRSWRLFDTVVDGRPVDSAVPLATTADNVWEIPLLDAGWPRSVVVLFAGELFPGERTRRLLDGEPLALSPPAIVGLPCRQVLWTVQVPAGITLRVAAPARLVTATDIEAQRQAARRRFDEDFQRAIARGVGWQQQRLRGFFDARRDGAMPAADRVWNRAIEAMGVAVPSSAALAIVAEDEAAAPDAGRLTIRAVRQRDPTVRGRALATLSLLACGSLAWMLARRRS
jgi:hypothetical protein